MGNLSTNKNIIVKTADGVHLKVGMTAYIPDVIKGTITHFKIVH